MDDQLFAHFLGRLNFSEYTRLRIYHDDHEGPSARVGDEWVSEDEILVKIEEGVSYMDRLLAFALVKDMFDLLENYPRFFSVENMQKKEKNLSLF